MQRWAHGHGRVRLTPRSPIGGIRAEETVVFCEGPANPCCNPPQMFLICVLSESKPVL